MFLRPLHRVRGWVGVAIAASLWLLEPQASHAQESHAYIDEDYDFQVNAPKGWSRYNPASLSVPGEVCRAWTPDGTATISIFIQKVGAAVHPREILDSSAASLMAIGAVVNDKELKSVAGMQAMWLVVEGDGTGSALPGGGEKRNVRTSQHWVAIPREKDIVVFLLNAPASSFVTAEATFKVMLDTLRIGGVQTSEQRAPEPPAIPAAAVNLDFEAPLGQRGLPQGWDQSSATPPTGGEGYEVVADREAPHGGAASGRIRLTGEIQSFGSLTQVFLADAWRGKRIRLSGWLRTQGVDTGFAGLWLRIDPTSGSGGTVPFDNMSDRGVKGTTGWKRYQVVLDAPKGAGQIAFGALLAGGGTAWVDDLELAVVGKNIPVTKRPKG